MDSSTFEADVFTLAVDLTDENAAPATNKSQAPTLKAVLMAPAFGSKNQCTSPQRSAILAEAQHDDVMAVDPMTTDAATQKASTFETEAVVGQADADILARFQDVVTNSKQQDESFLGASDTGLDGFASAGSESIADRCARLLSSAALSVPSEDNEETHSSTNVDHYNDMSDKVAKFALEALNEDEPKYTEKEMDVLHKKAKLDAQQSFEDQRQGLLVQMKMMETKMTEMQTEKQNMKTEMTEVHELVKAFEAMADTVAKKKDDEIYQLFEAKKQVEQEKKELAARVTTLEANRAAEAEAKAVTDLEQSEEINTLKDAHGATLLALQLKLDSTNNTMAILQETLGKTEQELIASKKKSEQLEAGNQKLQANVQDANANCDKYKHTVSKTRDQAQAQLNKAKQLVMSSKTDCANLRHTVASLEDSCKTNVAQLEAEQKARGIAETENTTLKTQVEKQQEEMNQLTLEAYRCTKAEQELEKQKKSNKELFDMCNELMKQVEQNKSS